MLNSITVMGRFTRDPELRSTQSGKSVCGFSLAVDRNYKNTAGEYDTDFINCTSWGLSEFISTHFSKGDLAVVTGSLQINTWQADDGTNRKDAYINVDKIYFCGGKKKDDNGKADKRKETSERLKRLGIEEKPFGPEDVPTHDDSDLPF